MAPSPLHIFLLATTCYCLFALVQPAKILHFSFMSSKSHKNVYEPLLIELGRRGHEVTIVTPIKSSKNYTNVHEIIGIPFEEFLKYPGFEFNPFKMKEENTKIDPVALIPIYEQLCPKFLNLPQVQQILQQNKNTYDLIFLSAFINECVFGIVKHFNDVPFALISPTAAQPFTTAATGNPNPSSFSPVMFLGYSDRMSFYERTVNFIMNFVIKFGMEYYFIPKMEKIYKDQFGVDTPNVIDIMKNVSLVLSNGHFSLNYPRPMLPEVVDVGGMHCRPGQPLPKDLDDFISQAKDGVIYFSLGSIVKGSEMPPRLRKMFLKVFSRLKQRVIWKWETDTMEGESNIPTNIKLGTWLPQQDILAHPNVKMFITHGGLLSTEEAVYHGKPLIGFPLFGDQEWNMANAKNLGFALSFDIIAVTEDELYNGIMRIINEPQFQEKASHLSAVFRDRPMKPLDLAIYWTEYIIRHKGAKHLRSAARELNGIQYHSTDVIAFLLGSVLSALYIILALLRFIWKKICGSSKSIVKSDKNLNKKKN